MARSPGGEYAEKLCRDFPDMPTRTLAKKLYDKFKTHYKNLESARRILRSVRGACGEQHLKYAKHPRPKQPAGWRPACPPSSAETWEPLQIDGPCKVLSLSDIHVPYHSEKAVDAAVKFGRKLKPDVLLLNGDIADFYNISRWEKDPNQRNFKYELDTIKQLLEWLRSQFPKARIVYKMGNHEDRYDKYVWNKAPELWGVDNIQIHNLLDFERLGIERVDDRPVMCGSLPTLHGHETGKTISSPVNPARGLFLRTKHTALIGHLHQTSGHGESNLWHDETFCWSQGALCDLCPPYLRINRWNHGFASIEVDADNQFDLSNYRLSSDFKVRTT